MFKDYLLGLNLYVSEKNRKYSLRNYVGVFLDDLIIPAKTKQEHIERVDCIPTCFSLHDISLNKEKFKFNGS